MALTKIKTDGINDDAVTLDKLAHGTSSQDGKFLRANNGSAPTFETVNTDLSADTTPQLGGDLQSNSHDIKIADASGYDGNNIYIGSDNDMRIHHDGSNFEMSNATGTMYLRTDAAIHIQKRDASTKIAEFNADADVELYHGGNKKLETNSSGVTVTGTCTATSFAGDGSNLTGINSTTINSNSDNRVITGSGTANTLNAESTFTHDPSTCDTTIQHNSNVPADLIIQNDSGGTAAGARLTLQSGSAANTGPQLDMRVGSDSWTLQTPKNAGNLDFNDNGTLAFKMAGSGNFDVIAGDVTINGSGKGIDFAHGSNTGTAANILDDYEEGTYDGTLSVTSGTLNMDTSHNQLSYTRIGRQCTITGRVQVSSVSGLSGYMTINLPFAVGSSTEYDHGGAGAVFMYNAGGVGSPGYSGLWTMWTDGGNSNAYFTYGDSTTAVNGAKVSAGTELRLTFTYFTS